MRNLIINPNVFVDNRKRFAQQMKTNSVAIFSANAEIQSNGDAFYKYQQQSDLIWLCGIAQADTKLLIVKEDTKKITEILFIKKSNPLKEIWDGKFLLPSQAQNISKIFDIKYIEDFDIVLQNLLHSTEYIYLNSNENDRKSQSEINNQSFFIKKIQRQYPLHKYERAATILKKTRAIKNKYEIELIQHANNITAHTFKQVLKNIRVGMYEYEIEAELLFSFLKQGTTGFAFNPIIASGDNARILHYIDNNCVCKNGDLVLMDFGVINAFYNSDITRTVPINGTFTKRQKEIYNACLQLNQYAQSLLKPKIFLSEYTTKVGNEATKHLIKLGLLSATDVKNEDPNNRAYRKYLYHGISHHLGLDVHDLADKKLPLAEGMVLTVEPGFYIEQEKIGIRLENNVVITKNGTFNLSKNIPIKAEDIELLMKK